MNILIIGATHGNELLGPKLYERLLRKRSPLLEHLDFIIGNPRAYAQRVRYIESDLNRSYGQGNTTYEERRANEIQQYINDTRPDLVVDMHTTTTVQPNIVIVGNTTNHQVKTFLRACHLHQILKVQPMHDSASITDNLIAYEVPNRNISPALLDEIESDLMRFVAGETHDGSRLLYEMTEKIYQKDVTPAQFKTFVNFEMHPLGYIPIMTGNNSYKRQTDYYGFKSRAPQELHL